MSRDDELINEVCEYLINEHADLCISNETWVDTVKRMGNRIHQLEKQAKSGYWYDRYVQLEIEKSKLEQALDKIKKLIHESEYHIDHQLIADIERVAKQAREK